MMAIDSTALPDLLAEETAYSSRVFCHPRNYTFCVIFIHSDNRRKGFTTLLALRLAVIALEKTL